LHEVLGWLNDYVAETGYVAGTKSMTIADISMITTYANLVACQGHIDLSAYPKAQAWFERVKAELPNYGHIGVAGAQEMGEIYKKAFQK
jgi:glutathione S-transferase